MRRFVAAVALVVLAGCGGDETADTTSTTVATRVLTVRVQARFTGMGSCTQTPASKGSDLVVKDKTGTIVATGSFAITPGKTACDFTATAEDVPVDAEFLTIESDGREVDTISVDEAEQQNWVVTIQA